MYNLSGTPPLLEKDNCKINPVYTILNNMSAQTIGRRSGYVSDYLLHNFVSRPTTVKG